MIAVNLLYLLLYTFDFPFFFFFFFFLPSSLWKFLGAVLPSSDPSLLPAPPPLLSTSLSLPHSKSSSSSPPLSSLPQNPFFLPPRPSLEPYEDLSLPPTLSEGLSYAISDKIAEVTCQN